MKKVSINIPSEIISHVEWCRIYMHNETSIKYTTTQIILYAIEKLYAELWNESIKQDS